MPPSSPLSTGSFGLDLALGGGCPPGVVVELYGPEESGKTTLCQHLAASCQENDRPVAWINCDYTFDPAFARRCGVDLEQLYLVQPGWLEAALEMSACLLQSGTFGLVVLDGLDALPTLEEYRPVETEPEAGYKSLLSPWLRRFKPALQFWQTTLVVTHQGERRRISQTYHALSGQLGRLALPLQAAVRIRMEPLDLLHAGPRRVVAGRRVRARVVKNPLKASLQITEFDIMYSQGVQRSSEVLDQAIRLGVIRRRGSGYSFGQTDLGGGREQVIILLHEPALRHQLELALHQALLRNE